MTVIVSEETGEISVAYMGLLYKGLDEDGLRKQLSKLHSEQEEKPSKSRKLRKGGQANE